jgi:hypothetical protein
MKNRSNVTIPFSSLTNQQRNTLHGQGVIKDLRNARDNDKIQVPWKLLTDAQQKAFGKDAPRNPHGGRGRNGRDAQPRNPQKTGGIIRTDLNCGAGTLSVIQGTIATVMAFLGGLKDKSAIILHGLSSGLRTPVASVIVVDGKFTSFINGGGIIPADVLKQAIQFASHYQNGVQLTMGWIPLYGVMDKGSLKVMAVQTKALNAFQEQADKDNLKAYLSAFNKACFTKAGDVQGQKHNHAILSAVPLTDGVRVTYALGNGEFAAIPTPGLTGELRHSLGNEDTLIMAKAGDDVFYGLSADGAYRYLNRVDQKPVWIKSAALGGKVEDISVGEFNQETETYAVAVTLQPNGKSTPRYVPVTVKHDGKTLSFTPDTAHAVKANGDDVAQMPPLARITRNYLAGVGHHFPKNGADKDVPAVSFLPQDSWSEDVTSLVDFMIPQPEAAA